MTVKRRSSTGSFVDLSFLRRKNSSGNMVDLSFLKRKSSSGLWVDIWSTGQSVSHTFFTNFADSYRLPGTFASGWRGNDIVYYAGESNNHKGYWFYGDTSNEGPGAGSTRTATSGRIRVYAGNYFSGTRQLVLRPHNYLSRTAGEPSYLSGTVSYNLPSQAWTYINLPVSWLSLLLNGGARGIAAYTTNGSQYMELNQHARIEVDYDY
jgi:hypothetical protein